MAKNSGHTRVVVVARESSAEQEISELAERYLALLQSAGEISSQDAAMVDVTGGVAALIAKSVSELIKAYRGSKINSEKVRVLHAIVSNGHFNRLEKVSDRTGSIFVLDVYDYDNLLKTGEYPKNIQHAQKFVQHGYDVFLLSNPQGFKSSDFVIRKRGKLYYVEGKTSTGKHSLNHNFDDGSTQADRVSINFAGNTNTTYVRGEVKAAFVGNKHLKEVLIFRGSRLIKVTRQDALGKQFEKKFSKIWNKSK